MTIENPISTIRKAVKGTAEQNAAAELIEFPEQKHYEEAFLYYKYLKLFEPEMYEKMISIGAKDKELKDEMGAELLNVFTQVLEEITSKNENKMAASVEQLKEANKNSPEILNQKILKLNKILILENDGELRKNSRLISAFSAREDLLNRAIDFTSSSMLDLLETDSKNPTLRML